jgi:hypothetical protein
MVLTDKLTAIGDAIREQTGSSELMTLDAMPDAIRGISSGGGGGNEPTAEELIITDDCRYRFAYGAWDWVIERYGNKMTTKDITDTSNMFNKCGATVPFDINMWGKSEYPMSYMFSDYKGTSIPMIHKAKPRETSYIFSGCCYIRNFPEGFGDDWDWSYVDSLTGAYNGSSNYMFANCYSLRSLPMSFLSHGNPVVNYTSTIFQYMCRMCYALDEIIDLPNPHYKGEYYVATHYQSIFMGVAVNCFRLKNFTFAEMDPPKWAGQILDLSQNVGWSINSDSITDYSAYHGITADKEVKDDATYQALKDDPDWFTCDVAYSRYNHDSAVRTINSLPDCSAYTTAKGKTNTIKFKGEAGSATDGGAINTLTEAEIAVATAKGWTVQLV